MTKIVSNIADQTIAFIGAGSMAESIIAGLISERIVAPSQLIATNRQDEERLKRLEQHYGIKTTVNKEEAVAHANLIVLAMKPKDIESAMKAIRSYTSEKQLFISVLAGISTSYITELLGHHAPVIRTMPNTSAKVGESATAISAGAYATEQEIQLACALFSAIGTVIVVPEEQLDAVTGLAGSGPAYIYYLVEAMEKAATEIGLDEEVGKELVIQTLIGAAKRLSTTSKTAEELYTQVMSPGGTTEAGLQVLAENHFQDAIVACIKRATERSKELGTKTRK